MDIIAFTDGSCKKNKKNKFCGCGVYFPNKEFENISVPFILEPLTNQRSELYAIYLALELITNNYTYKNIYIYSDSMYCINSITKWIHTWVKNNWMRDKKNPVKNIDILKLIYNITKNNKHIIFKHIKAHTNKKDFLSMCNAEADNLANYHPTINKDLNNNK
jgi:ribonuclease HI